MSKWHKRYCILREQFLFYYQSESDSKAIGVIVVPGYCISEEKSSSKDKFTFKLVPSGKGRSTYLVCLLFLLALVPINCSHWIRILSSTRPCPELHFHWFFSPSRILLYTLPIFSSAYLLFLRFIQWGIIYFKSSRFSESVIYRYVDVSMRVENHKRRYFIWKVHSLSPILIYLFIRGLGNNGSE